jgi:hypothetical protein
MGQSPLTPSLRVPQSLLCAWQSYLGPQPISAIVTRSGAEIWLKDSNLNLSLGPWS